MLVISLLIFSICIRIILLSIHDDDEIHQMVAFLSSLITLVCVYILIPIVLKIFLGILFITVGHKIFPTHIISR
ncbi:conserved hypothetical protein [Hyella patelloides LEGE 07179]|uniref:Uncharacterized protein n=1 Tax=Hyella patelloides LEGE 07179 TaxID=945734 RepID=A0A563W107_9CYAN|nr:conserved hypothetical protein [Hyella patelloides LEGE 07179]